MDAPAAGDVLVLGTDDGPVALDAASGSVVLRSADAVPGPDGSLLFAASPNGASTTLTTTDAASGAEVARTTVRGHLVVRVASLSAHAVALMAPLAPGIDAWTPVPRTRTTIVVADPTGAREPRRYRLHGNYEPEAFSVDDSRLFLIQYLPAEAPSVYRVTVLDLADGDVYPVFGRFKTPPERMPGVRLRQVFDGRKDQLYTLYTNEPDAYAQGYGGWGGAGSEVTFVHVLNLEDGWAYCAGLPRRFWGEPAEAQAMATSPDGKSLYVVDAARGEVSVMNTRTLKVVRSARVPLGALDGIRTTAQVSVDGQHLFVGSVRDGGAVYVVDATSLEVEDRWPVSGTVEALGLSPDGLRLYVALGDRVAVLDAGSGEEVATIPFSGADSIVRVGATSA
jgi:YVTN family beta-propeller protein